MRTPANNLIVFDVRVNSIGFDLETDIEPQLVAVDSGEGRHNHVMLHHEFLRNTYTELATVRSDSTMGRLLLVDSKLQANLRVGWSDPPRV
jgi:hypothetical protein